MNAEAGWDSLYISKAAMLADIQCYIEILAVSEGGSWFKRGPALLVAGDASEFAYAAYTPNGELQHPVVVTFSAEELQLMADDEFSSTLTEISAYLILLVFC